MLRSFCYHRVYKGGVPALLLLLLICMQGKGQNLQLKRAELQEWSGGIAGRHGKNYVFALSFSGSAKIIPDSLWIDGQSINVSADNSSGNTQVHITTTGGQGKKNWIIYLKLSFDSPGINTVSSVVIKPPVAYKGIALMRYKQAGAARYLEIKKITSQLPTVNYP
jgi:hypothetical protein